MEYMVMTVAVGSATLMALGAAFGGMAATMYVLERAHRLHRRV